jgi:hypothetical protein
MADLGKNFTLPVLNGPVRFAVGRLDGLTSNSWKCETRRSKGKDRHDIYIMCRDNFKEAKVSLHASGRWRMGFKEQALTKNPRLLPPGKSRAWQIWDEPPAQLPRTLIAFRLLFPMSELAVSPAQRRPTEWDRVFFLQALPPPHMTVVTLFVTAEDVSLRYESLPSIPLVSMDIGQGRRAQLIAHGDKEGDIPDVIDRAAALPREAAGRAGKEIPPEAYGYFLGVSPDGARFLVGGRMNR